MSGYVIGQWFESVNLAIKNCKNFNFAKNHLTAQAYRHDKLTLDPHTAKLKAQLGKELCHSEWTIVKLRSARHNSGNHLV